jgi:DNA-directed RNA polymerase III subunit RPC1
MTLTFPERVTPHNLQWIRGLVAAGGNVHPGANYFNSPAINKRTYLKYGDLKTIAQKVRPGDIVDRHLQDGDIVLFNRQPSLHKLSIMAHRVKVQNTRTFR